MKWLANRISTVLQNHYWASVIQRNRRRISMEIMCLETASISIATKTMQRMENAATTSNQEFKNLLFASSVAFEEDRPTAFQLRI